MNRILLLLFISSILVSCKKNDNNKCNYSESGKIATAAEISYLSNYLTTNSIIASQHSSGIFYSITNAGTRSYPGICSNIAVKYVGSLLNGTVFDSFMQSSGKIFVLGELIPGWQKGLPLIKAGGAITLYIPPSLGYGSDDIKDSNGNVVIPANSYLKFTIDLVDVQ